MVKTRQTTKNRNEVIDFCKKHKLDYKELSFYQIRVNNCIDLYPPNKKYCLLPINEWGKYDDLKELFDVTYDLHGKFLE